MLARVLRGVGPIGTPQLLCIVSGCRPLAQRWQCFGCALEFGDEVLVFAPFNTHCYDIYRGTLWDPSLIVVSWAHVLAISLGVFESELCGDDVIFSLGILLLRVSLCPKYWATPHRSAGAQHLVSEQGAGATPLAAFPSSSRHEDLDEENGPAQDGQRHGRACRLEGLMETSAV